MTKDQWEPLRRMRNAALVLGLIMGAAITLIVVALTYPTPCP